MFQAFSWVHIVLSACFIASLTCLGYLGRYSLSSSILHGLGSPVSMYFYSPGFPVVGVVMYAMSSTSFTTSATFNPLTLLYPNSRRTNWLVYNVGLFYGFASYRGKKLVDLVVERFLEDLRREFLKL